MGKRSLLALILIFPLLGSAQGQDAPRPAGQDAPKPGGQPTQGELEKKLEETMSNAVLVGHFTSGKQDTGSKEDRYTIASAKKIPMTERWVITAKIQYGNRGDTAAIPIMVPVKWAGDTPVISVTDLSIPGMGTYTARVMIFRDQYAGTWDAGAGAGLEVAADGGVGFLEEIFGGGGSDGGDVLGQGGGGPVFEVAAAVVAVEGDLEGTQNQASDLVLGLGDEGHVSPGVGRV